MMEMEEERLRMREHVMKNVSRPRFFAVLPSLTSLWLTLFSLLCLKGGHK